MCARRPARSDIEKPGVIGMLVRSRGDLIDLSPALPRVRPSGSVTALRVRRARGIDLAWRGGRLASAALRPARPARLTPRGFEEVRP